MTAEIIDLSKFRNEFVFHYGGEQGRVDAETLAASLLEFSGALREINKTANPDYDIEIYIEALADGSFRAKVKTINKKYGGLLSVGATVTSLFVAPIFTMYIYDKYISEKKMTVKIEAYDDHYVVKAGDEKIILPKETYDMQKKLRENPEVEKRISKGFAYLQADADLTDFGITHSLEDEKPSVHFDREDVWRLSIMRERIISEEKTRHMEEEVELKIVRAIFERNLRKWQFTLASNKDMKISAPILSEQFFDKLEARDYIIGSEDTMRVLLRTYQIWNEETGYWDNENYEILEVLRHTPGPKQIGMPLR